MKKIYLLIIYLLVGSKIFSQDSINVYQPVITYDTNAVCVGSVVTVPFSSTGVYSAGNNYIAQLSDSNGLFPANPTVIATISSTIAYPYPNQSFISGIIPDVPTGCNYYIRVVATNPVLVGFTWGPFCIQHCDIQFNGGNDIHLCLTPNNTVIDTPLTVHIHTWNAAQVYNAGNVFKLELLDLNYLQIVNTLGALGTVTATNDTSVNILINGLSNLNAIGISPGSYYLRIVASNTLFPDSSLSNVIRFSIGAPADISDTVVALNYPSMIPVTGPLCPGDVVEYRCNSYNYNSSYEWYGGFLGDSLRTNYITITIGGSNFSFPMSVREVNNGCWGPTSPILTTYVDGVPSINISSPVYVCLHDTNTWIVPYHQNTVYNWTSVHGTIIDTSWNTIKIRFDSLGIFQISNSAFNHCGSSVAYRNIHVILAPTAHLTDSISNTMTVYFRDTIPANSYSWNFGDTGTGSGQNTSHHYSNFGNYEVYLIASNLCSSVTDSLNIYVPGACSASFLLYPDFYTLHSYSIVNQTSGIAPIHYDWNWGDNSAHDTSAYPSHIYADSGNYTICLSIIDSTGCTNPYCNSYYLMRTANTMVYVNVISIFQVGIKDINSENSISIFPNPASTTLTIHSQLRITNEELRITDVFGRIVFSQLLNNSTNPTESTNTTIDISTLSNGIYFYEVAGQRGKFVKL